MKTIRRGSKGTAAKLCQQRLNANGFGPLVEDGDFGKITERAAIQYQQAHDLEVDGIIGPATWTSLMAGQPMPTPAEVLKEQQDDLLAKASPTPGLQVIQAAIKDLGFKEIPNGSNGGPEINHIVEGYWDHWGIDPTGRSMPPWCAISVSHWMKEGLGAEDWKGIPFKKWFGGCAQILKWATKHDCYEEANSGRTVETGEVFLLSSRDGSDPSSSPRAGHTGYVICDEGDAVITIEGNTSNAVKSLRRKKSQIMGFVKWWDAE
jgi:peptidoglycan hydrolase-like protein with peptidoglycan-binding domain